jgi:hypothetical protein
MIRFQPDTLRDALWRPISMAAPNSDIYMEIMAPDLRFAALVLLTLVTLVLATRRVKVARPAWLLLAFVWLAFLPWMATSGNGRYFLPVLLMAGPLCIALIYHLPLTASFRLTLAALLLVMQVTAVSMVDPRGSWGLAAWGNPYFEAELTREDREVPATYVLMAGVSYSLVAPLFHPDSHWIGLASLSGDLEHSIDDRRAQAALAAGQHSGRPLKLLIPTLPMFMSKDRQPNGELRAEMNRMLGPHRLALQEGACRIVVSRTLASSAYRDLERRKVKPDNLDRIGFWICPLQYPMQWKPPGAPGYDTSKADRVFSRLEKACPRLFQAGEAKTTRVDEGFARTYPSSDTKAMVMDDGYVWYRYWRALNSNLVGRVADVLADGFKLDCNEVHGRSGLPWERVL